MRSRTGLNCWNEFMRAKVTLRAKWSRVNSVFLVHMRKTTGTNSRGSARMKQTFRLGDVLVMNGGGFHCGREMLGKSGRVGSRNVHRTCTGNAERRRPVSGFEFSVLSSQFSVLSSQFSVLSGG